MSGPLALGGRRVLVTGGTRGVGAGVADLLARHGAELVLLYRADHRSAEATLRRLRDGGAQAEARAVNLAEPREIRRAVAEIGPLRGVVHAASLGSFKPVLDLRPSQLELSLAVNAGAFLILCREALPGMRPGGRIVAVSSLGARRVVPAYGGIGVAKAALEALVRYVAVEAAPRGVAVNGVAAGLVEDASSVARHPGIDRLREVARRRTPTGRLVSAREVGGVVLFLLSELAEPLRGQVLVADGGLDLVV